MEQRPDVCRLTLVADDITTVVQLNYTYCRTLMQDTYTLV